jgi:hypothetical protein
LRGQGSGSGSNSNNNNNGCPCFNKQASEVWHDVAGTLTGLATVAPRSGLERARHLHAPVA